MQTYNKADLIKAHCIEIFMFYFNIRETRISKFTNEFALHHGSATFCIPFYTGIKPISFLIL